MALTLVQSAGAFGGGSVDCTLGAAPSAGNLLVAVVTARNVTGVSSISNDNPQTWLVAAEAFDSAGSQAVRIFYRVATGVESATVQFDQLGTGGNSEVMEFSGATSWVVDKTATNDPASTGTSCQTGSTGTLANAAEVAVAAIAMDGTVSAGRAWDSSFNVVTHANGNILAGYKLTAATTALNPTGSWTSAFGRIGTIVTFIGATPVGKNLDLRWNVEGSVGKSLDLRWNVGGPVGKSLDLRWNVSGPVGSFTVRTEVAWDTDPLVRPGALDWSDLADVSPGIRDLSIKRGTKVRSAGLEAGTASCLADNSNRELDPSNEDSSLWPNVKPRKRIRFIVEVGGADVVLFTGFAERWPIEWAIGSGWSHISASDLFNILASMKLPASVLEVKIRELTAVSYWPGTENVDNLLVDDVIGTNDGIYFGPVQKGSSVVPYDPRPVPKYEIPTIEDADTPVMMVEPFLPDASLSVSVWFRWNVSELEVGVLPTLVLFQDASFPVSADAGATPSEVRLYVRPDDSIGGRHNLRVTIQDGTNSVAVAAPIAYTLFDGNPHHIVMTFDAATKTVKTYADDIGGTCADVVNTSAAVNFTNAINDCHLLASGWGVNWQNPATVPNSASVGQLAYWDRVISEPEITEIYEAGTVAWDGDTTGERAEKILDLLGVDAGDRNITGGSQICGPTILGSENGLAYWRQLVATEQNVSYVNGNGQIEFGDRIPDSPAVVQVFSDDPATDGGVPAASLKPDYSYDRIINTVVVGRENNADQTITNQTSVDAYGPNSGATGGKIDTLHQTADDARTTGELLVDRFGEPRTYIPAVTISANDRAVTLDAVTGVDIGDATEQYARPAGGGDPIHQTALVEALEHRLPSANKWTVTYSLVEHGEP